MKPLRQFLYLDEYKMYSLFSQMFEGFTEYIVKYDEAKERETESQKGPIGSGRVLADLVTTKRGQEERRFLNDYAYTLFEEELVRRQMLTAVAEDASPVVPGSIVQVTGTAIFNDMQAMSQMTATFNEFGEALAYTQTQEARKSVAEQAEAAAKATADRNSRARIRETAKTMTDVKKYAKELGLQQDPKLLEKIKYLLDYGYGNQFEVRFRLGIGARFYSAILKRDCLREDESLIVKKYGRRAEGNFSLIGVACQVGGQAAPDESSATEIKHLKQAIYNMAVALGAVETTFSGRIDDEYVLDPIALYRVVT